MTTYQPGRIYSGIVDGEREIALCRGTHCFVTRNQAVVHHDFHDVRGPLVVLDLTDYGHAEALPATLREHGWGPVADQIEEQTPPVQIGWHEVKYHTYPRYWDGGSWRMSPDSEEIPLSGAAWSAHFIGPASGDAS